MAGNKRREQARECSKRKMAKLSDEERKALYTHKSRDDYGKNADLIRERKLLKYRNDEEYRLRTSLQSKEKYQQNKSKSKALSIKPKVHTVDGKTDIDTQIDSKVDGKNDIDTQIDSKVDGKTDIDTKGDANGEVKADTDNGKIKISYGNLLNYKVDSMKCFEGITTDFHKYRVNFKHPNRPRYEIRDIHLNNDGVRYEYSDWKDYTNILLFTT